MCDEVVQQLITLFLTTLQESLRDLQHKALGGLMTAVQGTDEWLQAAHV